MKIPFCLPLIDEEVIQKINYCLHESGWITTGPLVKEFEEEISKLCETNFSIAVNSWTSGALLLFKLLNLDKSDEVIIPNYTYAATALSVINHGAKVVIVDVNDDFTIDLNDLKSKLSKKTKIIFPVDLGGLPSDYEGINQIINEYYSDYKITWDNIVSNKLPRRALIVSDAAHSIGSTIQNTPACKFADFAVFSFHSVKNITTGEGGAITMSFNDYDFESEIYRHLKLLSLNGQTKTAMEKTNSGSWEYDIVTNGLKINMPDLNAAIGLSQITRYKTILLPERRKIFNLYNEIFSQYSWAIIPKMEINTRFSSCHLYTLRIKNLTKKNRNTLIEYLTARGIGVNVHYKPLSELSYFKNLGLNSLDFPNSIALFENEISLPIYNGLKEDKVKYVAANVIKFMSNES